jgi:hypothetical protein
VKEDCAFEGEGSPAVGDGRCIEAAAMGTENKDRERAEVARRRIEANSLAVDASVACCACRWGLGFSLRGTPIQRGAAQKVRKAQR